MGMPVSLKEALGLSGSPIFATNTTGAATTGAMDMSKFNRLIFIGQVGALASANSTVDFGIGSSATSAGTGVTTVTGGSITQITAGNKVFTSELRADQLSNRYAYGLMSRSIAESFAAVIGVGAEPRYGPANTNDATCVTQRVVLAST